MGWAVLEMHELCHVGFNHVWTMPVKSKFSALLLIGLSSSYKEREIESKTIVR